MDLVGILADSLRTAFGPVAAAYAVAAIGLNLQFGYTGLLNFGHVAFVLTGAYGAALTVDHGGPLPVAAPLEREQVDVEDSGCGSLGRRPRR